MRLLEYIWGDIKIFSERPYGYKRYVVENEDGSLQIFSGLWYSVKTILQLLRDKK